MNDNKIDEQNIDSIEVIDEWALVCPNNQVPSTGRFNSYSILKNFRDKRTNCDKTNSRMTYDNRKSLQSDTGDNYGRLDRTAIGK